MEVVLPWPSPTLSPNARPNRFALAAAKKRARQDGYILTLAAGAKKTAWTAVKVRVTFRPPLVDRKRDADNMIASFKAYQDGIADAIKVDDAAWSVSYGVGEPVRRGQVTVEISQA